MDDSTHVRSVGPPNEPIWLDTLASADLAAALDSLSVSAWSAGVDGTVVRVSEGWTLLTGQSHASWEQDGWLAAVDPDDRTRIEESWEAFVARGGPTWTEQYGVVRLDNGARRVVADRVVRIGRRGDAMFLRVAEDITGRVAAETRVRELEVKQTALHRVAEFVAARHDTAAVAAFVARAMVLLFSAEHGGVVRFDEDGTGIVAGWWSTLPGEAHEPGERIDLSAPSAVAMVYRTGEAAHLRSREGQEAPLPHSPLGDRVAVPIRVAGRLWGALVVSTVATGVLTDSTDERLARFAELVALAVAETDAQTALKARVAQQAAVNALSTRALAGGPVEELFEAAVTTVAQVLDVPLASVVERHVDGDAIVRATSGLAVVSKGLRFPASPDTMTGRVLATGLSLVVDDFEADGRFGLASPAHQLTGMRGGACFVVRLPDRLWGVVAVFTAERRTFTDDDVRFLESVANVVGSTIERADSEQTIRHQAMHDALTGIPNRALLVDRLALALERATRDDTLVGVLALDLDRFAEVNDTYGDQVGDVLLKLVAGRLVEAVRPGDTVARLGGDEFAVVAEALSDPEEALALAERLARAVHGASGAASLGASIGVAVRGGGAVTADVLRDANIALHRAKANGPGGVELFDNEMRVRLLDRLQTEADLRVALEHDAFVLHYQPVVALADGSVVGLEGLVRWQHPTRGMLPPAAFISIAEETGAIIELGRFVIARACADAARWNAMRPEAAPVPVNVNLSPLQLADPTFPDFIRTSIAASGIAPGQLGLEITETVVFNDDPEHAARLLEISRRIGVRLLLDDFGTGFSSLSYIRRFPLDVLKLDRSFIGGLDHDDAATAIIVATCQLARALKIVVIAEGVERREQVTSLHAIGCEYAQGYFFARPLARVKVDRLLTSAPPWCFDDRRFALGSGGR